MAAKESTHSDQPAHRTSDDLTAKNTSSRSAPPPAFATGILGLQRAIGNTAVANLVQANHSAARPDRLAAAPCDLIQQLRAQQRQAASPGITQYGVTVVAPDIASQAMAEDVLRHEQVHRAQQDAYLDGTPAGTRAQLEAEACGTPARQACSPHFTPRHGAPPQMLLTYTLQEMQIRLTAIERVLERLEARADNQPNNDRQLESARQALNQFRSQLGGNAPNVPSRLDTAEAVIERVEQVMDALGDRRTEIIRTEQDQTRRRAYMREIDHVRTAYLTAVMHMFTNTAQNDFDTAEAMAEDLPRRLLDIDLARIETHAQSRQGGMIQTARNELIAWIGWFRQRMDAMPQLMQNYEQARRQRSANTAQLQLQLQQQQQLLQLSLRGIGHLDRVISAAEYYGDQNSLDPFIFGAIARLTGRNRRIMALSRAGNLSGLQQAITDLEQDQDVARFYQALPAMLGVSRMVTQLGVTLVSALVTAGVGAAAFHALRGTATTVGFGRMALALGGTAVIEGLVFTGVHTALDAAIMGRQPTVRRFFIDLAWNIGLFGTLRVVSLGVGAGMGRLQMPELARTANVVAAFPVLQSYGVLRFRLERHRMPTDAELQQMTAQNLIMLLAISAGTRAVARWLPTGGQQSRTMRYFRQTYGPQFEALEGAREALLTEVVAEIRSSNAANSQRQATLQNRAQVVEQNFARLLRQVEADPQIDIAVLRTEMAQARGVILEGSQQILQDALGVGAEVSLRPTNALRSYTYRFAGTNRLVARLSALGLRTTVTADAITGRRTVTAQADPGEAPITFVERAEALSGRHEIAVDVNAPEVQQLFTRIGLGPDPALRRTVIQIIERQWATAPNQNLQWATRQAGRELNARLRQNPGRGMDAVVAEIRQAGRAHLRPNNTAMVPVARQMAGQGFLRSQEWLDARTAETRRGAVTEHLARREAQAALQPGTRLLRNVYFIGTRFRNAQLTQPDRVRSTLTEADLMVIRETPTGFEAVSISNVKAGRGQAGAAGAQNQLALDAIDAMNAGQPLEVQEGGQTYYWQILRIEGTATSGQGGRLDLTGNLRQAAGGTAMETVGLRGIRGYSQSIQQNNSELNSIVELLLELQFMQSPEY